MKRHPLSMDWKTLILLRWQCLRSVYRFNAIPVKISVVSSAKMEKSNVRSIHNAKRPTTTKTILKNKQKPQPSWKTHIVRFQNFWHNCSNQTVWYWYKSESESHSVMSDSMRPHGLYSPKNSPGQNTAVGSLSLLQGVSPPQGSDPGLLHCRWTLHQLSHKGSPGLRTNINTNGTELSPERKLTIHNQLISSNDATVTPWWGENSLFNKWCSENWKSIWKRMKLDPNSSHTQKLTQNVSSPATVEQATLRRPMHFSHQMIVLLSAYWCHLSLLSVPLLSEMAQAQC